jgi:putative glutamine amidotransferase
VTCKPIIGISTNETVGFNGRQLSYSTGKRYALAVKQFADAVPVLVPSCVDSSDLDTILGSLHGLVLTGGRANVEPHHFNGTAFPADEPIDPERDRVVLDLIPACVDKGIPVFGICRGIQEINVAYGGTLYYRVHQELGKNDHRMPQHDDATLEEIFKPRHPIRFSEKSMLRGLVDADHFTVNSLHGQGIKDLGSGLHVEAWSDDGLIEAIRINAHPNFGIGIQWHAEFHPERDENRLNRALFNAFGQACRTYRNN